jgi:multiple sugar transport system permease protein/putative aldouronate transport system permease protein
MIQYSLKGSKGDRAFYFFNNAILTIIFIIVLYPVVYVVSASFSSYTAILSGEVFLWPVRPTLEGYIAVFKSPDILLGYSNTAFYTIVGTFVNVILTIMAAYPLSRKDFVGRNLIMFLFTFTMFFSGGMIPSYLLIKSLGLLNTRWVMIIPGAIGVWNVIMTRTFFASTIPDEMLEASQLDGCSNFKFVTSIVIPLSKPIIAVISLYYSVGHWNAFFDALIFLSDKQLYPLQIFLRNILISSQTDISMIIDLAQQEKMQQIEAVLKYSLIIVSSLPVMIAYPFVQKYFVKGVMIGALKG